MGYTRIIQAGEEVELYEYEKKYVSTNKRDYTQNTRRASSDRERTHDVTIRSHQSIKRARSNFLRIVTANIQRENLPAFFTFTIERETSLEVGYSYLYYFWKRIKKLGHAYRYIGVPEWQSRGVLHFHFLVWGLDKQSTDNKRERSTRNFQRQWHKGFLDVRNARYTSGRLAGYLAKYLITALADRRLGNRRAYTCSRNVFRPYSEGSNAIAGYLDNLIDVDSTVDRVKEYDTLWLGKCRYTKFIKAENKNIINANT